MIERPIPDRHWLVWLREDAWAAMLAAHPAPPSPTVTGWVAAGRPLVVRRPCPGEFDGKPRGSLALGLPLPPALGKKRLALVAPPDAIAAIEPPLRLVTIEPNLPDRWCKAAGALVALGARVEAEPRVFGSFAFAALTGLAYAGPASDLDLVWAPTNRLDELIDGLAAVEADAPGRLDVEIVARSEGAFTAVHWRELAGGADLVLGKSLAAVGLIPAAAFRAAVATPVPIP